MRLNISTKLLGGFRVVLFLLGVVGWMGISNMGAMSALVTSMYDDRLIPVEQIEESSNWLHRMRALVLEALIAEDEEKLLIARAGIADHETELLALMDQYSKSNIGQEEQDLLAKFGTVWPIYKGERDTVLQLKSEGKEAEALLVFRNALQAKLEPVQMVLAQLIDLNKRLAKQADQQGKATEEQARTLMLAIVIGAIVVAGGAAIFVTRAMSKGIGAVAEGAAVLANVNLPRLKELAEAWS